VENHSFERERERERENGWGVEKKCIVNKCREYCHVQGVGVTNNNIPGFDDWIYWHFFAATINYSAIAKLTTNH
jgi:hypothetical protein